MRKESRVAISSLMKFKEQINNSIKRMKNCKMEELEQIFEEEMLNDGKMDESLNKLQIMFDEIKKNKTND